MTAWDSVPRALKTSDVTEVGNAGVIIFFILFCAELFDPVCYCRVRLLFGEDAHLCSFTDAALLKLGGCDPGPRAITGNLLSFKALWDEISTMVPILALETAIVKLLSRIIII